jgi:hypothetical protein
MTNRIETRPSFFEEFIMMATGFMEILMLAVLAGGSSSTDLVSLIQPQHYFQSRDIGISVARAVELANMEPKDAKSQVMQLTALRYLYEETDTLKKSPRYDGHRKAIEQVAQGKNAQDPLGFAKEYAQRVLNKLDGAKPEAIRLAPVRDDALAWFPAHVNMVGALDLRQARSGAPGQDPLKDILKLMPENAKREMYTYIEQSGNIRLERLAFAMTENVQNRDQQKIFLRFTGKANREWAMNTLKNLNPGMEIKTIKDESGTSITFAQKANRAPIFAIVGDTELLMVGYGADQGKHQDVVDEVLAVRAKKQPNATTGALKGQLAKVPDKAVAFFAAELSNEVKKHLRFTFDPPPEGVAAFVERTPQGLDVQLEASMLNKEDAGKLVGKLGMLRKDGIQELQKAMQQPLPPGVPPIPFQAMINLVESIQVQDKGDRVQARAFVPEGLIQQMGSIGAAIFGVRRGGFDAPVPPPPKF